MPWKDFSSRERKSPAPRELFPVLTQQECLICSDACAPAPARSRQDVGVEEQLFGGNTSAEVVRVGSTVRRPTGPWTPAVHALLHHLESRAFDGAPRVTGIDGLGREILTYIDGLVVWPDNFDLVADDGSLSEVASLIRRYHDAVADFPLTDEQAWSDRGGDPHGPCEVLCHNDLAPWNLIRSSHQWAFIDWDLAAPGRRAWDLAWALLSFVPLMPISRLTDEETRHRIKVFRHGYGAAIFPANILDVAVERCAREAQLIHERGSLGQSPYGRLLAQGHFEIWTDARDHISRHLRGWQSPLAE